MQDIALTKIYVDNDFNCRGTILPIDVIDLAKDIEKNGLITPIVVQPIDDPKFEYRLIAGYNRYTAFKILKRDSIPCIVKEGLTELQARLLNLSENLKRRELNLLQEAKAIKKLRDLGLTQEDISAELGMSRTWVQIRFHLLDLPEEIQEEAAAGFINQTQIRQIYALPSKEQQYAAVRKIKDSQIMGQKGLDVSPTPSEKPFIKKRQSKTAVTNMITHIGETLGYSLTTRALAWAMGEINSAELYFDIKKEAVDLGIDYEIPFLKSGANV